MKRKKIILLLISLIFSSNVLFAEIKILLSVDDQVITNYDLIKESNYFEILNPSVKKLNNNQKLNLAKNSLIKEIIKKNEIEKFKIVKNTNFMVDDYMDNFYRRLGFNSLKDFADILELKKNYTLDEIRNKIKIDFMWNDLIYSKYKNQVKIDKKEIITKVDSLKDKFEKEFLLSEIVFKKKKDKTVDAISKEIKLSIQEIGFANTANIYSESESSKFGGKIGWISEISLSKQVALELKILEIGGITNLIKIGNTFLILKIEDIKLNKKITNREKEIQNLIIQETNSQLEKFSKIFFDKIKLNYSINEN